MDMLNDLRASIQRFKWSKEEEKGFQNFHDKVNLTIIRISIVSLLFSNLGSTIIIFDSNHILLAILCVPVVLKERTHIQILVILIVCVPCIFAFMLLICLTTELYNLMLARCMFIFYDLHQAIPTQSSYGCTFIHLCRNSVNLMCMANTVIYLFPLSLLYLHANLLYRTDSAIIFFFVLHIVHLSGLLRFSYGAVLSCIYLK